MPPIPLIAFAWAKCDACVRNTIVCAFDYAVLSCKHTDTGISATWYLYSPVRQNPRFYAAISFGLVLNKQIELEKFQVTVPDTAQFVVH